MVEKIQQEIEEMKARREEIAGRLERNERNEVGDRREQQLSNSLVSPIHEAINKVDMEDVGQAFERTMKRNRLALEPIGEQSVNQNETAQGEEAGGGPDMQV